MVKNNSSTIMNGNNHTSEHMITLNIHIPHDNVIHSMQFDIQMLINDICYNIQQHLLMTIDHDLSEYGLFINDAQHSVRSYWLDPTKTLNYYALKNEDHVEYKNRYRPLKIRLLDGTVKTILIDDSLIVAQLMVYICTKFGIANYDEYSLVYDIDTDDSINNTKTATLLRILDSSYTAENHRHCIDTSRPLVQAIDELYTYAMLKEFASIPPTISSAGRQLQEPILLAARNVVDGACRIIECSKALIVNSKEASLWQQLATHTKSVSEAIKRLATSVKEMTPGQQECERAVDELRNLFQEVDKAIINVDSLRKADKSLQFHQEQISSSSHFLTELINNIRQSSKCEPECISSYVSQFITYLEPFIHHTIHYVSYMIYRNEKIHLLEQIKSLVETSLQLIFSTKESGGNIKNLQWHKIIDNNSDLLIKLIYKLIHTIEEQSSSIGIMNGLCENVRKLISTLDTTKITHQGHFIDYQIRMIEILQQMIITIEQIHASDNIRHLANQLTRQYNELINITYGAIGTVNTNDLSIHIKNIVQDLVGNLSASILPL
ncbi:unnamed protein product [Rotaria sp. Silwood2]|nr:unnamed protein product [Rotaria sp. Silwood2]